MKKLRIFVPAGLGLLAVAGVMAQQAQTSWTVPEGARVTVDRQSGRVSILMPREISDRRGLARGSRSGARRLTPAKVRSRRRAWRTPRCPRTRSITRRAAGHSRETAGHSLGQWRLSQHVDRVHRVPRRTRFARLFHRRQRPQ